MRRGWIKRPSTRHKLVLINRSSVSREVDAALVITDPIGEVLAQL